MINRLGLLSLAVISLFIVACQQDAPVETTVSSTASTAVEVPRFDRDSAFAFVAAQVEFGPRVVNTAAHENTKAYLVAQLKRFGARITEQDFIARAYTGEELEATNIIGRYRPDLRRRILLAAHWDSRHIADSPLNTGDPEAAVVGADDGASGVAVLLEIARQLQKQSPEIGVDIVFFDAEDYGESNSPESWGLGAQHFARNFQGQRPVYGILLDMVGAKKARFPIEGYSRQFAPQVVNKVWRLAYQLGYGSYFVEENGSAITDDHYFINTIANIPMIDIIHRKTDTETGFGEHWHTDKDDLSIIDRRTLRAVGQTVLTLIYREATGAI